MVAALLLAPVLSSAQNWAPFGTGSWSGTGQSGGFVLVTSSAACTVGPGCAWGVTYGGAELIGAPTDPNAFTHLSFSYKPSVNGSSGGSPRLILKFSDNGDAELRPLTWIAGQWATVDGLTGTNWDSNGGSCGYRYAVDWTTALACHPNATITEIDIINDSGWEGNAEQVELAGVNVNGIMFAPTKNDCKNGGFLALGFSNQGQCVSYFMNNTP
jgi:hypothetical protein